MSQGLVQKGVISWIFGVGRGRLGSIWVGLGAGTFSCPIRAPESDRSELWKLCSTFMENFHSQTCTGSIMEICSTLWKKSVNNRFFMEICCTLWKFVVLYGNFIAISWKKKNVSQNSEMKHMVYLIQHMIQRMVQSQHSSFFAACICCVHRFCRNTGCTKIATN